MRPTNLDEWLPVVPILAVVFLAVLMILLLAGCGRSNSQEYYPGPPFKQPVKKERLSSSEYIDRELKIIKAKGSLLRDAGRYPETDEGRGLYMIIGRYAWHSYSYADGYFGAYSFYQSAFDQAMRSWFIRGIMEPKSDILRAGNANAKFDKSVVGYSVGHMYQGPERAKVIEFIDARTLRLDKKSKGPVEQWGLPILPPDYVDMCDCTNNWSPFQERK